METYKETILINARSGLRKKKMFEALDDFDSVDDNVILPSSLLSSKKDKKENKKESKPIISQAEEDDNSWLVSVGSFIPPDMSNIKGKLELNLTGRKGKKKKKKKKGAIHDYKSEFEPEMNLLKNIKTEQSKFVHNLQTDYNQLKNSKTANRGVGKFTTDFISALTSARSLEMQAVKEIVSLRKTIADLDFKERKEFGAKASEDININNQASLMLKQMVSMGRNNIVNGSMQFEENTYEDYNDDDELLVIDEDDDDDDHLKFESRNIEVVVEYDKDIVSEDALDKYNFVAYDSDGEVVYDYPLPTKTKMSVNESTEIAIDALGRKYKLKIV